MGIGLPDSSGSAAQKHELVERLGQVIKAIREDAGVSQRELAEKSGLKQSQISEIESGKASVTIDSLARICRSLDVQVASTLSSAERGHFTIPSLFPFARLKDSYESRLGQWASAKHFLAECVAYIFRSNFADQFVGIDGGTTNQFVADAIGRDVACNVPTVGMIVTNHMGIPQRVSTGANAPNVHVTGGVFRYDRNTLIGSEVVKSLQTFEIAASVVGANGFHFPFLFTRAGMEDDLKNAFLSQSREVIIPLPPAKWGHVTGRKLISIETLVSQGKKVCLLGVYLPMPDFDSSDSRFYSAVSPGEIARRRETFCTGASQIVQTFHSKLKLSIVAVTPNPHANEIPQINVKEIDGTQIESLDTFIRQSESGYVIVFNLTP